MALSRVPRPLEARREVSLGRGPGAAAGAATCIGMLVDVLPPDASVPAPAPAAAEADPLPVAAGGAESAETDAEWSSRRLCSDGNCIGVIGPDGRCRECGKPYAG